MSGGIDREVGLRLRRARVRRGLSMQQVARALGVSVTAVHKWETGRSGLTVRRLRELCDLLGVGWSELLGPEVVDIDPSGSWR